MNELRKVEIFVNKDMEKVWNYWTYPEHIVNWYFATDSWHCPSVINNLRVDGDFLFKMEAKDGSTGFDFTGTYKEIVKHKKIKYILTDGRKVEIEFKEKDGGVHIIQAFEPESTSDIKLQEQGWQSILDNFKTYAEGII